MRSSMWIYPGGLRVDIDKIGRWTYLLTLAEDNTDYVTRTVRGSYKHAKAVARRWLEREAF